MQRTMRKRKNETNKLSGDYATEVTARGPEATSVNWKIAKAFNPLRVPNIKYLEDLVVSWFLKIFKLILFSDLFLI